MATTTNKPKYELTEETIEYEGHRLYRIRALKDFGDVKEGDLGGWIDDDRALSFSGNCWVYGNAKVFGGLTGLGYSQVTGDAKVMDNAVMGERTSIKGNAILFGDASIEVTRLKPSVAIRGEMKIGTSARITNPHQIVYFSPEYEDYPLIKNMTCYIDINGDVCLTSAEWFGNVITYHLNDFRPRMKNLFNLTRKQEKIYRDIFDYIEYYLKSDPNNKRRFNWSNLRRKILYSRLKRVAPDVLTGILYHGKPNS